MEINKIYYIFGQVEGTEELQISKSVMISDNFYCHEEKGQQTGGHLSTPLALPWESPDLVLSSCDWSHLVGCGGKEDLGESDWESISSARICPLNATLIDSLTLRPLSKMLVIFAHPAPTLCLLDTALWFFFGTHPSLAPVVRWVGPQGRSVTEIQPIDRSPPLGQNYWFRQEQVG